MAGFSASPTFVLGFMQASHHGVARRSLGIIVKSVGFVVVVVVVDRGNPLTSFLAGKKKKKDTTRKELVLSEGLTREEFN